MSTTNPSRCIALLATAVFFLTIGCDGGDSAPADTMVDGSADTPEGTSRDAGLADTSTNDVPDVAVDTGPDAVARSFPDDFLFGTAISGFQAEMGCPNTPPDQCQDRNSDWYKFITADATVNSRLAHLSGDPPTNGPGFWELYDEDIGRIENDLNNDAFRMSIEWSRIFPESTEGITSLSELEKAADDEAVAHYHEILDALESRGIEPMVTLNHYSLPLWIHDPVACHRELETCSPRGWLDRERTVREIAKFAKFAAHEFGDSVDLWVTLNEPLAVVIPGYLQPSEQGTNPPAVQLEPKAAKTVWQAMIEAHARMYDALHARDGADADGDGKEARVGLAYNFTPVRPKNPENPKDVEAANNLSYL